MVLHEQLATELREMHSRLTADGKLPSVLQLQKYYDTFRQRFGPAVLRNLDGEALLETMHGRSEGGSLVYWLEFKNDDELPAIFGSIAGGSALKFGVFYRRETGAWTGRDSGNYPVEIPVDKAITIARTQRDQLLAGAQLLEKLPAHASDADYQALQNDMDRLAPNVSNLGWGHKYFHMLFPEKLDDYHNPDYQRFHLIKLLQVPPIGDGRYIAAGRYVAIANELEIPINHLTTMLNMRHGGPYRYWRIGTSDRTAPRNRWDLMRDSNCVAIGWPKLGDLSGTTPNRETKETIREALAEQYPNTPQTVGRILQQVWNFVTAINEGDLVVAADGATVLGIGKVVGGYSYDENSDFPHRRPVEWLSLEEWKMPTPEGLQTSVYEMNKDAHNRVVIEERILGASPIVVSPTKTTKPSLILQRLSGIPGRIQAVLERKRQVILYGPPGTGKTHWAERTARELAARSSFGVPFDQLPTEQQAFILGNGTTAPGTVRMCSFHPAYGYEDFLEGYRPESANGQLVFTLRDGIFKRICNDAEKQPEHRFYLIIDEINRGDIPRIFGELLTVLEKNKRGKTVLLPVTGRRFHVPDNVYLIGTMNTADRSIALLDTALRRRFGFIELMPDSAVLGNTVVAGIPLGPWLDALNQRVRDHVGRNARNLQIGHAYLLEGSRPITDIRYFARVLREDIIPLLEEYCYEDYAALEKILGGGLVDSQSQCIRDELFDGVEQETFVQAVLAPYPEIMTSLPAMQSEAELSEEEGAELELPDDVESEAA